MKKIILWLILIGLLGGLFFAYKTWENKEQENLAQSSGTIQNFVKVKDYLLSHYDGKYPIPKGDIILLNSKGEMIHLEDRKTPLSDIKDLFAIQGTTCDILKNDENFNKINYDIRYSIFDKKTKKVLLKKCFAYSVTKDGKNFQIGTVDNGNAKILGTFDKSIIKAYDAPVLVKAGQSDFLPYAESKLSPIFQVKNLGNTDISFVVKDNEYNENTYKLKEGNNNILSQNVDGTFQIKLAGKLDKKTSIKFIDTDGSIVYIKGDDNGNVNFNLKDYKIDSNRIDYILETGRFLADVIRLSPDKDMTVSKKGTTLVIRGTKFSVDCEGKSFSTYLMLGKILQELSNGDKIDITQVASFTSLYGTKFVSNLERMKKMISFIVYNDITNYPKYNYTFTGGLSDILSGNKIFINYENGQKIGLLSIAKNKVKDIISNVKLSDNVKKSCNGKSACLELAKFSSIVDSVCKKNRMRGGLDLSKLHYLLNVEGLTKFKLKPDIEQKVGKNYVILTTRKGGANGAVNESTRVGFRYNGIVEDISLKRLSLPYAEQGIENVVFACEN